MRRAVWTLMLAGCGSSTPRVGPLLEPADSLFIAAHVDDDMIFMQPELLNALATGSVTTVYVTSGDPEHGDERAERTFDAARIAYASVAGSSDWDCGYLWLGTSPIHHCRLRDRPVSLIGLDIPDGGREGQSEISPLHLVEQRLTSVPILGPIGGRATVDSIVEEVAALITTTRPKQIHTLDLAQIHGRDHSSHLFAASFVLWGAARAHYRGELRWHRGYNIDVEPVTLVAEDYAPAKRMLGYFEACYFHCGPCGSPCTTLDLSHDLWLQRQYSSTRTPIDASGPLVRAGGPPLCMVAGAGGVALGECAGAAPVTLDATGHLTIGGACVASPPDSKDPVVLEPCAERPAQYWVADGEGHLWNGSPPQPAPEMDYDHVRCLSADAQPGASVRAAICGAHLDPRWRIGL